MSAIIGGAVGASAGVVVLIGSALVVVSCQRRKPASWHRTRISQNGCNIFRSRSLGEHTKARLIERTPESYTEPRSFIRRGRPPAPRRQRRAACCGERAQASWTGCRARSMASSPLLHANVYWFAFPPQNNEKRLDVICKLVCAELLRKGAQLQCSNSYVVACLLWFA